jgi:hypothetical protein
VLKAGVKLVVLLMFYRHLAGDVLIPHVKILLLVKLSQFDSGFVRRMIL